MDRHRVIAFLQSKKFIKPAVVVLLVLLVIYRVRFSAVSVDGVEAELGSVTSEVLGTGTLEARVGATISAKISGRISQVLVDQGDRITKGQLLVTLDDGDLRQQVEIAKADLAMVKASVERAMAAIASAEATAVAARSSSERAIKLLPSKAISQADLERATQGRDVAEAELRRAQLAKVELERQISKSQESLRYSAERLADTTIFAPFDGLVLRREREAGDIVVPGSSVLQLISTDEMWISAWVDETAMGSVAVGQEARVVFRSEPERSYHGTVSRRAPLTDRETREFLVDVTVKELPSVWAAGQRAEVFISVGKKDQALLVPDRTIVWQQNQPGVFIYTSGRARWTEITLGLLGQDSVEVINGISRGDIVISPHKSNAAPLTDGQRVSLVNEP